MTLREDESLKARAQAGKLNCFLPCDHLVIIQFSGAKKKKLWTAAKATLDKGLESRAKIVHEEWLEKKRLVVGLKLIGDQQGPSVIIGPIAGKIIEAIVAI